MTGRTLFLGFTVLLAAFTGALWYFQYYAFYDTLERHPLVLSGIEYPTETWDGIDAASSPLKKRVCLTVSPDSAAAIAAAQTPIEGGEPLVAPSWFDCFNAKSIATDLKEGKAALYLIAEEVSEGVHEFLALSPNGRGYIWRELDDRFKNQ